MLKIAPSLLASNFSKLGDEIGKVEKAGADIIHIDIMDGHFVPNLTIGPPVVKSLRPVTKLTFDVHLMVENPDTVIDAFAEAGADIISVHVESCYHLHRTIQKIRECGCKPALALNPATPLSTVEWLLKDIDMILIMTVNPGFGGQTYIKTMTQKVRSLRKLISDKGLDIDIEVDGGIDTSNIFEVTEAGANVIVSGSTIFKAADTADIIGDLRSRAYKL